MTGALAACNSFQGGLFNGITNQSISDGAIGTSTAEYEVRSNGNVVNHNNTVLERWHQSPFMGSSYEVRATLSSGSTPSGTLGSWLALSSNRSWSVTDSIDEGVDVTCVLLVEIGLAGTSTALDSATITLSASSASA